jgi:hypothetical protein
MPKLTGESRQHVGPQMPDVDNQFAHMVPTSFVLDYGGGQ